MTNIASAGIAGLISDIITNPLWLVRTRIQSDIFNEKKKYSKLIQTICLIYKETGFFSLFKGLGASIIGLSHVMIYYPLYEILK